MQWQEEWGGSSRGLLLGEGCSYRRGLLLGEGCSYRRGLLMPFSMKFCAKRLRIPIRSYRGRGNKCYGSCKRLFAGPGTLHNTTTTPP
jgi:hypothetical protein